jgi:hypothetical protein
MCQDRHSTASDNSSETYVASDNQAGDNSPAAAPLVDRNETAIMGGVEHQAVRFDNPATRQSKSSRSIC